MADHTQLKHQVHNRWEYQTVDFLPAGQRRAIVAEKLAVKAESR